MLFKPSDNVAAARPFCEGRKSCATRGAATLRQESGRALALSSVWVCARNVGPMAARGWFVLQLERHHGRRVVHEQLEELQVLRRGFWLSRWLMEKTDKAPIDAQ
jgi:hypothetical protein